MAIAFELATVSLSSAANPTFTHAGTAPQAVAVTAVNGVVGNTSAITAVTYGGAALTLGAVGKDSAGEPGTAWVWGLGSSAAAIPTGSQTVAITKATTDTFNYCCLTYTGSTGNMTVFSTARGAEDQNSSAITVTGTKGTELGVTVGCWYTGTGSTTATTLAAGLTGVDANDFGAFCGFVARETTPSSASFAFAAAQAADDWAVVVLVLEELASTGGAPPPALLSPFRFSMMGVQ